MPETLPANAVDEGRIVTFYSYKGGTGRSMAMANVAWLLALSRFKVLAIDWDLEAPGLHRYFRPFLDDPDLAQSEGLIDFAIRFAEAASEQSLGTPDPDWYKHYSNLLPYAKEVNYDFPGDGRLDFIPAGRQDTLYADRVNSFNWKHFYEKLNGGLILREARRILKEEYDYILIDSRTGVSDTAGICTVEMPDDLVVAFTLNLQSVIGASKTAASVIEQRAQKGGPIRVFPVPMRVEPAEKLKTDTMKAFAKPLFVKLLPEEMTEAQKDKYWDESDVPYIAFYAFEENLAYFRDAANDPKSVLSAINRIANRLTPSLLGDLPPLDPEVKATAIAAYDAFSGAVQAQKVRTAVYLSADSETFLRLRSELALSGLDVLSRERYEKTREAVFLLAIGPSGLSPGQNTELAVAETARKGPVYTVLLPGASPETLPRLLLPYGVIDLRSGGRLELPDPANELPRLPLSPYPGLNPFTAEDGTLFVARGPLIESLFQAVTRSKFVALVGPQHSGKTSLVQAGLIPRLTAAPGQSWEVRNAWPAAWNDAGRVLVVIDATALAIAAVTSIPNNACVLAIAESSEQVSLCEQRLVIPAERIEVPPLSDSGLMAAIAEPAARAGLSIEDGLASRIVVDLKNEKAKLPLLQFLMSELYSGSPRGVLTIEKYERMGGIQMVDRKCETVFGAFQGAGLSSLSRMVYVIDGGALQPQAAPEDSIRGEDHALLDAFVSAGIVVREAGTVRFSNRIFLDRWTRLRKWVEENRVFLLWRQRLDQSLAAWQANPRLFTRLSGAALSEAQDQVILRANDLNESELIYIADSGVASVKASGLQTSETRKGERKAWAWIVAVVLLVLGGAWYFFSGSIR